MKRKDLVILIIDDSIDDRDMIALAFRKNGVKDTIYSVGSVRDAMDYLSGERDYADRRQFPFPSLVMTDLKMPQEDGFALLEQLKSNPQWKMIPILVMSGATDSDDVKRCYSMGASCYLQKPADLAELRRLLHLFYDFWRECHIPEMGPDGVQLETKHEGKLGERFGAIK